MSRALVGTLFSPERRTKALAWLTTGVTLCYIIGAPIVGALAGYGGWRFPFLGFCLPLILIAVVMAFKGLPDTMSPMGKGENMFSGYSKIFREGPALACLLATMLTSMAYQSIGLYSTSFYREVFNVSASVAASFITVASLISTIGIQASSWMVSKYGRRNVSVVMGFISGLGYIAFMLVENLLISLLIRFTLEVFAGFAWNSVASLTLEHGGDEKGSIMSLYSAFMNMGLSLGSALGGLLFMMFGYSVMGAGLGLLQLASVIMIFLFTSD
jgi:DHA1 family purine base/nucleoside efflux pump-like MFS transporter